jgi:hypothetical protein
MYRKEEQTQIPASNFELTFEGKLSADNRWVIMANLIPGNLCVTGVLVFGCHQ